MMVFTVYGAGTPIRIDTYSPEAAEAVVVEEFGGQIEKLVTVAESIDDLLS